MTIFDEHNLERMNEDDVAGELVRPLCRALGYKQGSEVANLRSQFSLQYDRLFLGHKDAKKDPVLRGRPDFVCEVVSHARWVVEAKRPSVGLTLDDSYQAHTYATHPEIAAEYYMLTNGRVFQLFRVGKPEKPFFEWALAETDDNLPALRNILGPEAMRRRSEIVVDLGKPLAEGLPSRLKIIGGEIVYVRNIISIPIPINIDGLRNSIVGTGIERDEGGLIVAQIELKGAFAGFDELSRAMGFYPLEFRTSDAFISRDINNPTLLQNVKNVTFKKRTQFPKTMISEAGAMLFDISATCYTEAVGFIDGDRFRGVFVVDYDYALPPDLPHLPPSFEMRSEGTFEIIYAN